MTSKLASGTVANLTAEQGAALAADDRSLALAAGAGCGKTLVLTERFLAAADRRSAGGGSGLAELAAITFTDAAAREMRSRIRRACYDRLRDAPTPTEADAWLQLMRDIDSAQISTFHSFCAALLRRCAVEADVDPRFELLDQAAANLLQIEIVDDLLRELLDQRDERVLKLAAATHIERLRDDLTAMLGETLAMPEERVNKWLEMTPEQLADHWRTQFHDEVAPAARDAIVAHEAFRQLSEVADPRRGDDPRLVDHLAELGACLRAIERGDAVDSQSFMRLRDVAKVHAFITAKKWRDAEDHSAYRDACQELRKLIDKSPLLQPFDSTLARENAALSLNYLSLAVAARRLVSQRKAERRQLDFSDLILGVHRLMTDSAQSATAKRISSEIKLLMVDEFQDTDPLQVELVQALVPTWQKRGLFVVGDAKQSIYRFRGAAPEVSRELRESLPKRSRLSLTHNFRSQPAIIDFVNGLFYDALDEPYEPLQAANLKSGLYLASNSCGFPGRPSRTTLAIGRIHKPYNEGTIPRQAKCASSRAPAMVADSKRLGLRDAFDSCSTAVPRSLPMQRSQMACATYARGMWRFCFAP